MHLIFLPYVNTYPYVDTGKYTLGVLVYYFNSILDTILDTIILSKIVSKITS